jgi:uncharacterized protein (TIGR00255 family)
VSQQLASMTGFARATGAVVGASFICEIKSVNGRGLDIRLRLAPGLDELEGEIRQRVARSISRGSISITVTLERDGGGGQLKVNAAALATVIAAINDLRGRVAADPPTLDGILALPGVLEQQDSRSLNLGDALHPALLASVSDVLVSLVAARRAEGQEIARVLRERLAEIEILTARAETHPARSREVIAEKLRLQVASLAHQDLPMDRLAQEALLLATKADIQEELDRLRAHIAAARKLLDDGGAVGRKLDFLAQEFNREANTLCSKANAVELTAIGLDLKAAIDQLREQVQNIE